LARARWRLQAAKLDQGEGRPLRTALFKNG
jgi:hypothetical protein